MHADPHLRDAEPVGGDGGGELHRLARDDVRAPLLDEREHPRERGAGVQAREQVADDVLGRRPPRPDRRERRVDHARRGLADGAERQPGAVRERRRRSGARDVVAGARAGPRERDERAEVAGAAGGREQDAHTM